MVKMTHNLEVIFAMIYHECQRCHELLSKAKSRILREIIVLNKDEIYQTRGSPRECVIGT